MRCRRMVGVSCCPRIAAVPEAADDATKAAAATRAMMFSRTNTLLSIPMLYAMIAFNGG